MSAVSWWSLLLLALHAGAPAPASARTPACTDAAAAEEASDQARESWASLYAQYLRWARAMDCDDGGVAEGWSDAVARLLARSWDQLPALARLAKADPDFLPFVIRHVDATAWTDDLERARANAESRCPSGGYGELCRLLAEAAAGALAEDGCPYASPPGDEADARRRLEALAPGVRWSAALRVDLAGKDAPDHVILGRTRSEAVVGVVLGSACDVKFLFRFKKGAGQGELCGEPAAAHVAAEALAMPDDPGAPLAAKGGPSTRRAGFRLESGACEPFHFYFDGRAARWWRR